MGIFRPRAHLELHYRGVSEARERGGQYRREPRGGRGVRWRDGDLHGASAGTSETEVDGVTQYDVVLGGIEDLTERERAQRMGVGGGASAAAHPRDASSGAQEQGHRPLGLFGEHLAFGGEEGNDKDDPDPGGGMKSWYFQGIYWLDINRRTFFSCCFRFSSSLQYIQINASIERYSTVVIE